MALIELERSMTRPFAGNRVKETRSCVRLIGITFLLLNCLGINLATAQEDDRCPFQDKSICSDRIDRPSAPKPSAPDEFRADNSFFARMERDYSSILNIAISLYSQIDPNLPIQYYNQVVAQTGFPRYDRSMFELIGVDAYNRFFNIPGLNGAYLVPQIVYSINRHGGLQGVRYLLSKNLGNGYTLHAFSIRTNSGFNLFGAVQVDSNNNVLRVGIQNKGYF